MEEARNAILKEVLHDFKKRNLVTQDLRRPYEGFATKKLKRTCLKNGINPVDYDLAFKELENESLIGAGPMDVADPKSIDGSVLIFPFIYNKREFVFLKEKGYKEASKITTQRAGKPTPNQAVVHGDQIINYGQAGAMGRHSTGTINFKQRWEEIGFEVDLRELADELEQLRKALLQKASTPSDFAQLGVIAEAELEASNQDGSQVLAKLSKAGKGILGVARDIGTDIAAKVIAKSIGLEP